MGGKWKAVILSRLFHGTKRFSELYREVPDITERMLTLQLRELERDKLIHRKVYREVPPRVEYSLTEEGESLRPLLKTMKEWGAQYAAKYRPDLTPKSRYFNK